MFLGFYFKDFCKRIFSTTKKEQRGKHANIKMHINLKNVTFVIGRDGCFVYIFIKFFFQQSYKHKSLNYMNILCPFYHTTIFYYNLSYTGLIFCVIYHFLFQNKKKIYQYVSLKVEILKKKRKRKRPYIWI